MKSEDWISVEGGLPEQGESIALWYTSDHLAFVGFTYVYEGERHWSDGEYSFTNVTHWQYITPPNAL